MELVKMKIKNNGALVHVRKVPKNGDIKGRMFKSNIDEAITRGKNNIVYGTVKR